jgi:hypothetical protein
MCTPDQLLARTEADLEVATRRREIAQAIAADWGWWSSALTGTAVPQDERETVAQPTTPAEPATPVGTDRGCGPPGCRRCGEPIPPRKSGGGGRPKVFCSQRCGTAWHAKRCLQRKREAAKAAAQRVPAEIELPPDPLGDIRPEERPMQTAEYEDKWLQEQLRLPRLPWEGRPETH